MRPHDLRHTWASHLTEAGVPPEVLRRLGGWSTLQMVQRYGHGGEEAMRSAIEVLR
jgi:integrase